ncbi:hypothetical protein J6590_070395 [Homalodisca vitripennis]|nr:hypothetical protein J6590_070395 [Homalodisca vitripennis]
MTDTVERISQISSLHQVSASSLQSRDHRGYKSRQCLTSRAALDKTELLGFKYWICTSRGGFEDLPPSPSHNNHVGLPWYRGWSTRRRRQRGGHATKLVALCKCSRRTDDHNTRARVDLRQTQHRLALAGRLLQNSGARFFFNFPVI